MGVNSIILRTATRLLLTLLLLFSLFLLWRGHNEPGGGFIGGLIASGAFTLYLIAFGGDAMRRVLRVEPHQLLGVGLAIAIVSGVFAIFGGDVYMTGQWLTLNLGNGAEPLKLGTPLLFDVGVYLVVIGFTLTIVLALDEAVTGAAADN